MSIYNLTARVCISRQPTVLFRESRMTLIILKSGFREKTRVIDSWNTDDVKGAVRALQHGGWYPVIAPDDLDSTRGKPPRTLTFRKAKEIQRLWEPEGNKGK